MSLIPKDAKHSCITSLHHFCGKWILGAKITKQEQAKKNIRLASAPLFTSHLQINRAYCLVLMSNKKQTKKSLFSIFPPPPFTTPLVIRWGVKQGRSVCQETSSGDVPAEGEEEEGHGTSYLWQEFRGGGEKNSQAKCWVRIKPPATRNLFLI